MEKSVLFNSAASTQIRSFSIQSSVLSSTSSGWSSQYIRNLSLKSQIHCVEPSTKNLKNISIVEICYSLSITLLKFKNQIGFYVCKCYDIKFYGLVWKYFPIYFVYLEQEWVKVWHVSNFFILTMYLFKDTCLKDI